MVILKFCCILYKKVATQTSQVRGGCNVSGKKDDKFYLFIDEVQLTTKVIDKENDGIEVSIYDMLYGGMPRLLALTDEKDKKKSSELINYQIYGQIYILFPDIY